MVRWRRISWPSVSASSHLRWRGEARARDSWASSTVLPSEVTSRAVTKHLHDPLVRGVRGHDPSGHAAAGRLAGAHGHDQPQQKRPRGVLVRLVEPEEDLLIATRHRTLDNARGLVAETAGPLQGYHRVRPRGQHGDAAPLLAQAGGNAARTSEDLPLPEGPTTATTCSRALTSRQAAASASRPKNCSASSTS